MSDCPLAGWLKGFVMISTTVMHLMHGSIAQSRSEAPALGQRCPANRVPVGEPLLYVEPIYLQAEAAAYPELPSANVEA